MSERTLQVFLDTTSRCNLRCRMCLVAYQEDRYKRKPPHVARRLRSLPQEMSKDLFLRIAEQIFPRTKSLSLSCGFEPLMNPSFGWFLEQTSRYSIPTIGFTTNGLLLSGDIVERCVQTPVHEVSVSLDGARAETYEAIRPGARWERVVANIRQLVQVREEAGVIYPRLRLNYVLMRRNIGEVVEFVDLAADLGADVIDFRHVVIFDIAREMAGESLHRRRRLANRWLLRAQARADRLRIHVAYLPLFPGRVRWDRVKSWLRRRKGQGERTPRCTAPWETLVITPLGFVGPCAGWMRDPPLGNLASQSFDEIVNGPAMNRLRGGLLGQVPLAESCRVCPTIAGRGTEDRAFTSVELDRLDRIWLETYRREYGWDFEQESGG